MRIAHLKIGLFALVLAAPVAALLLFGSVESFGSPHPDFPPIGKALRGKKGQTDRLGEAILQRSAVMKLAIQLRNFVSYRLVGFVDTEEIVSGNGKWLFYRPEFAHGRCLKPKPTAILLRRLGTLIDVGRAAGIDLHVSISPDKSTIYPESLSRFARAYWKCRPETVATLRRLLRQELPALIDHAEPLLAEKARRPDLPLYYVTDTHWTPYGGAIALRQLLAAIYPGDGIPPAHLSGATTTRGTDLSNMLLWPAEEDADAVDPFPAKDFGARHPDVSSLNTLIVHDSFYIWIKAQVREIFPNAVMIHIQKNDQLGAAVLTADRLIVNLVERSLLRQTELGALKWEAPMPIAIVTRNMQRAQDCGAFETASAETARGKGQANGKAGQVIAVRDVTPGHLPCLRLSLTASDTTILQIKLPNATTGAFEPGRVIRYRIPPGSQTIGFVLPDNAAGAHVQMAGFDRPIAVSAIEIGEIERPRLAVAGP